jgi:hypothetical protein
MTFYVEGPAFWAPSRLRHLLHGYDHDRIRKLREITGDAARADQAADGDSDDVINTDEYFAQLLTMGRSMACLTHLECYVSEVDKNGGLLTAAEPCFQFLCRGQKLKEVILVYGDFADQDFESHSLLFEYHQKRSMLLELLATSTPWPQITKLTLSIATDFPALLGFLDSIAPTLRYLTLEEVTLLPNNKEGLITWEVVFSLMAPSLSRLEQMNFFRLQDFPNPDSDFARILFDPRSEEWNGRRECFDYYLCTVVEDVLGNQRLQLPLGTVDFMEQHTPICKHTIP